MDATWFSLWLLRTAAASGIATGGPRRRTKRASNRGISRIARLTAPPAAKGRIAEATADEPSRSGLRIRCFGCFEVTCGGRPVLDWRRNKARVLLKYLVDRRHPIPRDVLLDLLWPEAELGPACNNLRVTLHALRQALGPADETTDGSREYVIFDGGNVQLNPRIPRWIDVEEFARHFAAGFRKERQNRADEAVDHYERCEELYRADYLVEDLYEDWTLARREELKDQYLLVVTRLADHCLATGDWHGSIVRCHRILQKDSCREDAYQRLMLSYARLHQPSQARHWYDVCGRTLRKELDTGPSEATVQLYQQIISARGIES